jgi:hypothetical protein
MRVITIIFLLISFSSCYTQVEYDDKEFDKLSKTNKVIVPNGTYLSENMITGFNIPVLYVDSTKLRMEYLDSNQKKVTVNGTWTKQSFDTQLFSFGWPFNRAILAADGIYFLDSFSSHFFEKTSDNMVPLSIPDSLNLKK